MTAKVDSISGIVLGLLLVHVLPTYTKLRTKYKEKKEAKISRLKRMIFPRVSFCRKYPIWTSNIFTKRPKIEFVRISVVYTDVKMFLCQDLKRYNKFLSCIIKLVSKVNKETRISKQSENSSISQWTE